MKQNIYTACLGRGNDMGALRPRGKKYTEVYHHREALTTSSAAPSHAKAYRVSDNIDFMSILASLLTLLGGALALTDSIQQLRAIEKEKRWPGWESAEMQSHFSVDSTWGTFGSCILRRNTLPGGPVGVLIAYSTLTSAGWVASQRAVSRVISINSTPVLSRGFQVSDLSPIFTLEPSWKWLRWRTRLWPSSLFWLICIFCYVGTSFTAKVAFTPRTVSSSIHQVAPLNPLIGCNVEHVDARTTGSIYSTLNYLASNTGHQYADGDGGHYEPDIVKLNNWTVSAGWHGPPHPFLPDARPPNEQVDGYPEQFLTGLAFINATYITGLSQPALDDVGCDNTECITNETNRTLVLRVEQHPICGPLILWCDGNYPGWDRHNVCTWHGLGVGSLSVRLAWGKLEPDEINLAPVYSIWNAWELEKLDSNTPCPLSLNSSVYETVTRNLHDDLLGGSLNLKVILEMLLAHVIVNPSLVLEPAASLLRRNGIMRDTERDNCLEITGNTTADITWATTEAYFIPWELALAGALVFWGVLLAGAALPFRSRVVTNSVNQWLSFGADAGVDNVEGASTGINPPQSDRTFVVVNESKNGEYWRVSVVGAGAVGAGRGRGVTPTLGMVYGGLYI
ncbi:hypothetical protein B0J13DRAFT_194838 [Dactylonectria estremocensis]|uniref:Uncharacterized protein n=1 Tax=Dactylonectria estremocensis TaxID=1079267 RepID=A0A9P9DHU5_9HYPO|nr:hypothetical protein B0J13DRAFT_194838 [Dactylonectria estremocensis]